MISANNDNNDKNKIWFKSISEYSQKTSFNGAVLTDVVSENAFHIMYQCPFNAINLKNISFYCITL